MPSTYGTGTPTQFTTGEARQVLELGELINYFNPSESPLLTLSSRMRKRGTPVPEFEWMEDEYFIQRSIITTLTTSEVSNATAGNNDTGAIVTLDRLSYLELFERGAVYDAVVGGSASLNSMLAYMCIAIGDEVGLASGSTTDKMVQFVGIDTVSGDSYTYDEHATTVAILTGGANGTLQLTYAGNAGAGSLSAIEGARATQTNLTNNDVFTVRGITGHAEGAAVHKPTRKKVRRIKNCTMIFREPYDITRTQRVSKMYGPYELDRLQARKLKKIKTDIEWALLTRGAIDLDATAENPKRKFQGFGMGGTAGVPQTLNADVNSSLQFTEASGTMTNLDDILKLVFEDQNEGSGVKDFFCSGDWINAITARVRATSTVQLITEMGKGVYAGYRVTRYMGPIGALNLIRHPMMRGSLRKYGLMVDWANFEWRPLSESDLQLRVDIVQDGQDGQTDEWLIEAGPEIRQEQTHAILKLV